MSSSAIVQKLWNYCNVLRDDGMSYGDYVEQLTYLLFLKMADERTKPPYNQPSQLPDTFDTSRTREGKTDTLSVILKDNTPVVESDEDKPGIILDYDATGNLVSLEILDASTRVNEARKVDFQKTG